MKSIVYVLFLLLIVGLSACSQKVVQEDVVISNEISNQPSLSADSPSNDVLTELECSEEQGHVVYSAGGYGCEAGEIEVGLIEELNSPAICCRLNI